MDGGKNMFDTKNLMSMMSNMTENMAEDMLIEFGGPEIQRERQYEIDSIEFIDRIIPLHIQQLLGNISRMLNEEWNLYDTEIIRNDFEQQISFWKNSDISEQAISNIVTLKKIEEEENLTILQVAVLRFVNLHLPHILSVVDRCNWKNEDCFLNKTVLCKNVEMGKKESWFWEIVFEIMKKKKRYDLRGQIEICKFSPSRKISSNLKLIKESMPTIKKEIVSADSIKELENLKVQYEPYAQKADKLNNIVKKFSDEQKMAQKVTIEDMRKIVELLEKNLNGKLSTGDMVEAEKQLEHWKRELDSMTGIVKEILVEV